MSYVSLTRVGLSVLRALYDFVGAAPLDLRRRLPADAFAELSVARGLLFLEERGLSPRPAPLAYVSDRVCSRRLCCGRP